MILYLHIESEVNVNFIIGIRTNEKYSWNISTVNNILAVFWFLVILVKRKGKYIK